MTDRPADRQPPVLVPIRDLSREALRGLVEAFVLREGTDYGEREVSFEVKVGEVIGQLERGEVHVVYDPNTESVDIVPDASAIRALRDAGDD